MYDPVSKIDRIMALGDYNDLLNGELKDTYGLYLSGISVNNRSLTYYKQFSYSTDITPSQYFLMVFIGVGIYETSYYIVYKINHKPKKN